ncbi:hypothetical protein [Herbiconiux oxytropis]|uniref:hypothetical protein n=1 Tax=Herbiconiux oxytropis TaxID=2970915 RepID=UPI002877AE1A|nr:hypothetical protein [Herbiconiux oxytropis]
MDDELIPPVEPQHHEFQQSAPVSNPSLSWRAGLSSSRSSTHSGNVAAWIKDAAIDSSEETRVGFQVLTAVRFLRLSVSLPQAAQILIYICHGCRVGIEVVEKAVIRLMH